MVRARSPIGKDWFKEKIKERGEKSSDEPSRFDEKHKYIVRLSYLRLILSLVGGFGFAIWYINSGIYERLLTIGTFYATTGAVIPLIAAFIFLLFLSGSISYAKITRDEVTLEKKGRKKQ